MTGALIVVILLSCIFTFNFVALKSRLLQDLLLALSSVMNERKLEYYKCNNNLSEF